MEQKFPDHDHEDGSCSPLPELPQDVMAQLSGMLSPNDLCNLALTCRKLYAACNSDQFWITQCRNILSDLSGVNLPVWRNAMPSYKAIFRFVQAALPLLGIWVHQNPELGNMVYVTWGFLSVVGCRIIPQELGPRGLDTGLLWAPVFEIIANADGSLIFFLHGTEKDKDFFYPGCIAPPMPNCNVLILEAEPRRRDKSAVNCSAAAHEPDNGDFFIGRDEFRRSLKTNMKPVNSKKDMVQDPVPFHKLHFVDRRKILEAVARHVRFDIPTIATEPLFPTLKWTPNGTSDVILRNSEWHAQMVRMSERRSLLIWMHSHGDPKENYSSFGPHYDGIDSRFLLERMCKLTDTGGSSVVSKPLEAESSDSKSKSATVSDTSSASYTSVTSGKLHSSTPQKLSLAKVIREKMKQIIGMGQGQEMGRTADCSGRLTMKRLLLQRFLRQGDTICLRLHAAFWNLSRYRTWPLMHDNRFALYKMPEQKPEEGKELAGLWGGTFGWPPGKPAEDKSGKALYILLLSYDDTEEGRLLIATKILEGTHYVLHPNGSPMFTVKMDEPSSVPFPWIPDKDETPIDIVQAYQGEGIANGYGFRYPGSKPGDLFIERKGMLAFVWRDSHVVLTLQRLNLQALLEKGEKVAALPPVANFVYLTNSFNNVFAGYCGCEIRSKASDVHSH